jgi:hypothetical protein
LAVLSHGPDGGPAARLTEVIELTEHVVTGAADTQTAKAPIGASPDETGSEQLLSLITSSLDQDGAEDILEIALAGKSALADYMVVASGRGAQRETGRSPEARGGGFLAHRGQGGGRLGADRHR